MKKKGQTIIVVGAGAAGLMAAKTLSKKCNVVILEANERVGGRINTVLLPGFTQPIEAGAEFIHGKPPLTLKLLKKANLEYHKTTGNFYHAGKDGLKRPDGPVEGWNMLLKEMKKENDDMDLQTFLQKHFAGEEHSELRQQAKNYAEGFDVADITRVSMKALYSEWSDEDHAGYRIQQGYGALMDHLAGECLKHNVEIVFNKGVCSINWAKHKVIAGTTKNEHYAGDKCIITTPLHFLKPSNAASIQFSPFLEPALQAASEIGYGDVIKIVLEFDEPFWNSFAKDIGFILSDQPISTWWTQLPDRRPMLTGWTGGPSATELSKKNDDDIFQIAIISLSNIFKMPEADLKEKLVASKVFNWLKAEFAKGAYSYPYPSSGNARQTLRNPIEDTIFFAGEALYDEQPGGTVEAALVSGREAASLIKDL